MMSDESTRMMMVVSSKVEMLTEQNEQLRDQIDRLKKREDALMIALGNKDDQIEEMYQQLIQFQNVKDSAEEYRRKWEEAEDRVRKNKEIAHQEKIQMENHLERIKIQHSKVVLQFERQLMYYKNLVKSKSQKLNDCSNQLHSLTLSQYNPNPSYSVQLPLSHMDQCNVNLSKLSQINASRMQKSTISHISHNYNQNDIKASNIRNTSSKISQSALKFIAQDKQQLKITLKTLSKASKTLLSGQQQMIDHRQKSRINKTLYK